MRHHQCPQALTNNISDILYHVRIKRTIVLRFLTQINVYGPVAALHFHVDPLVGRYLEDITPNWVPGVGAMMARLVLRSRTRIAYLSLGRRPVRLRVFMSCVKSKTSMRPRPVTNSSRNSALTQCLSLRSSRPLPSCPPRT